MTKPQSRMNSLSFSRVLSIRDWRRSLFSLSLSWVKFTFLKLRTIQQERTNKDEKETRGREEANEELCRVSAGTITTIGELHFERSAVQRQFEIDRSIVFDEEKGKAGWSIIHRWESNHLGLTMCEASCIFHSFLAHTFSASSQFESITSCSVSASLFICMKTEIDGLLADLAGYRRTHVRAGLASIATIVFAQFAHVHTWRSDQHSESSLCSTNIEGITLHL